MTTKTKEKTIWAIQFLSDSPEPDGPKSGEFLRRGGKIQGFQSIEDANNTWDTYFRHNFGICNITYRPTE
jgi:hypothetical protein